MTISRRNFIKNISVGLAGVPLAGKTYADNVPLSRQESEKLLVKVPDQPEPAPVGVDRLPLSWYKATVKRLKEKAAEKGIDVIVLADQWNMVYFTGNFMTKTERPA